MKPTSEDKWLARRKEKQRKLDELPGTYFDHNGRRWKSRESRILFHFVASLVSLAVLLILWLILEFAVFSN